MEPEKRQGAFASAYEAWEVDGQYVMSIFNKKKTEDIPQLTVEEAEEILSQVFMDCYEDANSIPVEQLESYSNYRSERMNLQRIVAELGLLFFLVLPCFFARPQFTVSDPVAGARDLPVYTVRIENFLPIYSVTAVQKGYSLPVYQKDKRIFTIEPVEAGPMTVTVTLFSRQWESTVVQVGEVDEDPPILEGTALDGNTVYVYVTDEGSGIDYDRSYGIDNKGHKCKSLEYDESVGYLEFDNATSLEKIIIFDNYGNKLSVSVTQR